MSQSPKYIHSSARKCLGRVSRSLDNIFNFSLRLEKLFPSGPNWFHYGVHCEGSIVGWRGEMFKTSENFASSQTFVSVPANMISYHYYMYINLPMWSRDFKIKILSHKKGFSELVDLKIYADPSYLSPWAGSEIWGKMKNLLKIKILIFPKT